MKIPWNTEKTDSLIFELSLVITVMTSAIHVVNRYRKQPCSKEKKENNFLNKEWDQILLKHEG